MLRQEIVRPRATGRLQIIQVVLALAWADELFKTLGHHRILAVKGLILRSLLPRNALGENASPKTELHPFNNLLVFPVTVVVN